MHTVPPRPLRPPGFGLAASAVLAAIALGVLGCSAEPTAPTPAPPTPPPREEQPGPALFEDITAASGVAFNYRNGEDTADHLSILESLGGGIGLIDYDGDGLLDIF